MVSVMASLTLRPWGPKSSEEPKLKDVLGRVAYERGHFRDITEASLQEEISTEDALPLSSSDDESDDEDEEQAATGPATMEEVIRMRQEMHSLVSTTLSTDVSLLLDTVSLELSKYKPDAARTTLSAVLQQQGIPLGSLGTDVWQRMPEDTAREEEDEVIAANVRWEGLQESADNLLAAATRLNENVRKETQYWERVLSISEKGWNVCRIPGPQRLLGVTFGFSESAPEFSRRGIAALTTTDDGELTLGRGFGRKPKALRVVVKRDGKVVGVSRTPETDTDAEGQLTLDQRIRHARDSLFDEELYHEMIREARTVSNFGVRMAKEGIIFIPDPTHSDSDSSLETVFQLVSLDEDTTSLPAAAHTENPLAQTLALAARLLLSRAHREELKKRSEIPPPMSGAPPSERERLPILRPLMSFLLHRAVLRQTNDYLRRLRSLLTAAGVDSVVQPARLGLADLKDGKTAEALTATLLNTWTATATLTVEHVLISPIKLQIHLETTLGSAFGTIFSLSSSPQTIQTFDTFDSARQAADRALALKLAGALAEMAGKGWECEESEALLVRSDDGAAREDAARHVWVVVDGVRGGLAVCSGRRKVEWDVEGGERGGEDLWGVWERVLS
ncbi:hypothetical protein EJ03DRAFT_365562 [Teratosphaeria nubilosa]|uniref:Mediator of RNA polymerase II transcription subunit 17 n=1 Tax=Teratosphaeria nubilosa TaxID=161662 RepID=A0A6G1L3W7_9PEZI|nr:hypothetical protein EJ03DRAFT_365562 [Teratosphaeria nubilosa]